MKRVQWKTGGTTTQPRRVQWPSVGQVLGQLVTAVVVCTLWGASMVGFLSLTGKSEAVAQAEPEEVVQQIEVKDEVTITPTSSPTPAPSTTPTQTPTSTPTQATNKPITPTVTTAPASPKATATPEATATPQPTASPTPIPTETPTPAPTEPPVEPTEAPPADSAEADAGVSFANDIMPIIERRCIKCHGGINDGEVRIEEGLDLTSYDNLIAGSYNGPVIEPGDTENSYLIEQIVKGEMPKKEPRLLPKEVKTITEWVKAGAPNN